MFVTGHGAADWTELTEGDQRAVRVSAPDLQRARREAARLRPEGVSVILDVAVVVAEDFRSARNALGAVDPATVHYAGTVDGLAGLIADIGSADVADGVTLIPGSPQQDVRELGRQVLDRLHARAC